MSDDFFAPPAFKPEEAVQRLARELRELGLAAREGRWERRGQAIAKATVDGAVIVAAVVKRPGRSPEWQEKRLKSSAEMRDFVADLKKKLAGWGDHDE